MSIPHRVHVSLKSVYLWSLVIYVACAALVSPFVVSHGLRSLRMTALEVLTTLPLIYIHELLHLVAFRAGGGVAREDIAIGISWRYLIPHIDLRAPVEVRRCRFATVLPGIVTGLLPMLAGALLGSGKLLLVGGLMTAAAGGDVAVLMAMRGIKPGTFVEFTADWATSKA
jgi:hypothetical protein